MKEERRDEVLSKYHNYLEQKGGIGFTVGCTQDSVLNEIVGYHLYGLDRDSDLVKELNDSGFRVIYPLELKEEEINLMPDERREDYYASLNDALIVDTREERKSLQLSHAIASKLFSFAPRGYLSGYDLENNSMTEHLRYIGEGFGEDASSRYQNILNDLGYTTELDDHGDVKVLGDVPYQTVEKSKLGQIYDLAKGKMKDLLNKISNVIKPKGHDKQKVHENDKDEI